jgi:outer membrane lipoprotein-sorting protein
MNKKWLTLLSAGILTVSALTAQTADDVINKNIEARGGMEKLKALQNVVMEGNINQAGNDIVIKITLVSNKASRVEFSVAGQTGYTIITPTEGWAFNPFTGATAPDKLPEEQVKESLTQLDLAGAYVDYKSKGNKVEYLGKETIDGKECSKIKLTRANGKTATYYFDSNAYVIRTITTSLVNGTEQEVTTDYSDFRKTPEGYVFPYKRVIPQGEMSFDKITVNTKIDDAIFKPGN